MKKILSYFLLFILAIILIPKSVSAEDITVHVKQGMAGSTMFDIVAEKDVTTMAQLKDKLVENNIDLNEYMVAASGYDEATGYEVVCSQDIQCWGPTNALEASIYLYPIDHTEKKYTLKSVVPKDESMASSIFEINYELFEPLGFKSCNDTFDVCKFMDYSEGKVYDNVKITYEYNKNIASISQKLIDQGFLSKTAFKMKDVELLNYFNYGGNFISYSTEFKNQLSNLNFTFDMDQRGGGADPFETAAIGFYLFSYNGTLYGVKDFMSITAEHIVYVPSDTTDVKKALEDRLKTLFGDDLHLTVTESTNTIDEENATAGIDPIEGGDQHYYILTVNNPGSMLHDSEFYVIVKKDSSKVDNNNIAFRSSDLLTKVSVSTKESVPLDTIINVDQITSGDSYNKIIKALSVDDAEIFDISLNSIAQKKNIKKLDNGKFQVSIPVPDKYKGKDLVVYYVDADNNTTAYEVKVNEDGYAVFETDHFSTYALTVGKTINNPGTLDNIEIYFGLFMISALGVGLTIKKIKKTN